MRRSSSVQYPTFSTLGMQRNLGVECDLMVYLHMRFSFTHMSILAATISALGCTRYDPYAGETFDCECGNLNWGGRDLNLRMAKVEALDSVQFRYHIVADLRQEEAIVAREEPRDVVLTLTTELGGTSAFLSFLANDENFTIQQVNSPNSTTPWTMDGASVNVMVGADMHTMTINELSARQGNTVLPVTGTLTFDLVD